MNLYHAGQQSKAMLEAMQLRDVHLFNMKRRAEAKQKRNSCQTEESVSKRIPLDRDVVLTMQIQLKDHASLLKLDIPHDDDSVLKIRQQLDVLFQFADGSEGPLPNGQPCPGYTNVTIKGPVHKVEEARARLENLIPITVTLPLELKKLKPGFAGHDFNDKIAELKHKDDFMFPKISVDLRQAPAPSHKMKHFLSFTGAFKHSDQLAECVTKYRSSLYKEQELTKEPDAVVGAMMDVPPEMRGYLVGKPDGILMRMLSTMSDTLIHFPSISAMFSAHAYEMPKISTNYYFSGKVANVITAFKIFQEALPISLKFNVEEYELIDKVRTINQKSDGRLLNHYDDDWNLHIVIDKNPFGGEQIYEHDHKRYTGVITTSMANFSRMYGYRRAIMKKDYKGPRIAAKHTFNYEGSKALRKVITMNTKYGFVYSVKPEAATGSPVYAVYPLPQNNGIPMMPPAVQRRRHNTSHN